MDLIKRSIPPGPGDELKDPEMRAMARQLAARHHDLQALLERFRKLHWGRQG